MVGTGANRFGARPLTWHFSARTKDCEAGSPLVPADFGDVSATILWEHDLIPLGNRWTIWTLVGRPVQELNQSRICWAR